MDKFDRECFKGLTIFLLVFGAIYSGIALILNNWMWPWWIQATLQNMASGAGS